MGIKNSIINIYKSRNFKHGILYTIFSFFNSGINFILLLTLARYLTPAEYGSLNLFTTFVTLLSILISLCSASYVAVSFFQKSTETLKQVILTVFSISTVVLVILSVIAILLPSRLIFVIGIPQKDLLLGVMICYLQVYNLVNLDIWRLEERPVCYGMYSVSFAICNFILTFWFIIGMHQGWQGRVTAWIILATIYFLISIAVMLRRKYLVFNKLKINIIRETLLYSLPLIPHSASFWLKQGLDRYIVNYFYNQSVVGYFSFAMNLAAIITIVGTAFNATNSVYIYKKLAEGYSTVRSILNKQIKLMSYVFLCISVIVGLFAFILIHYFLEKYEISIQYIFPFCLGAFFQCIYLLWVNYLFYYKKTKELMHITLSTAILQMLLSIWLTRYSPMCTAWVSTTVILITMLLVKRKSKQVLSNG